jgi:hypothetical protein
LLRATGPRSRTYLKTGTDGLCGVPVGRSATDAIRLHDPDIKRTPGKILFPGNKKVRFIKKSDFLATDGHYWTQMNVLAPAFLRLLPSRLV